MLAFLVTALFAAAVFATPPAAASPTRGYAPSAASAAFGQLLEAGQTCLELDDDGNYLLNTSIVPDIVGAKGYGGFIDVTIELPYAAITLCRGLGADGDGLEIDLRNVPCSATISKDTFANGLFIFDGPVDAGISEHPGLLDPFPGARVPGDLIPERADGNGLRRSYILRDSLEVPGDVTQGWIRSIGTRCYMARAYVDVAGSPGNLSADQVEGDAFPPVDFNELYAAPPAWTVGDGSSTADPSALFLAWNLDSASQRYTGIRGLSADARAGRFGEFAEKIGDSFGAGDAYWRDNFPAVSPDHVAGIAAACGTGAKWAWGGASCWGGGLWFVGTLVTRFFGMTAGAVLPGDPDAGWRRGLARCVQTTGFQFGFMKKQFFPNSSTPASYADWIFMMLNGCVRNELILNGPAACAGAMSATEAWRDVIYANLVWLATQALLGNVAKPFLNTVLPARPLSNGLVGPPMPPVQVPGGVVPDVVGYVVYPILSLIAGVGYSDVGGDALFWWSVFQRDLAIAANPDCGGVQYAAVPEGGQHVVDRVGRGLTDMFVKFHDGACGQTYAEDDTSVPCSNKGLLDTNIALSPDALTSGEIAAEFVYSYLRQRGCGGLRGSIWMCKEGQASVDYVREAFAFALGRDEWALQDYVAERAENLPGSPSVWDLPAEDQVAFFAGIIVSKTFSDGPELQCSAIPVFSCRALPLVLDAELIGGTSRRARLTWPAATAPGMVDRLQQFSVTIGDFRDAPELSATFDGTIDETGLSVEHVVPWGPTWISACYQVERELEELSEIIRSNTVCLDEDVEEAPVLSSARFLSAGQLEVEFAKIDPDADGVVTYARLCPDATGFADCGGDAFFVGDAVRSTFVEIGTGAGAGFRAETEASLDPGGLYCISIAAFRYSNALSGREVTPRSNELCDWTVPAVPVVDIDIVEPVNDVPGSPTIEADLTPSCQFQLFFFICAVEDFIWDAYQGAERIRVHVWATDKPNANDTVLIDWDDLNLGSPDFDTTLDRWYQLTPDEGLLYDAGDGAIKTLVYEQHNARYCVRAEALYDGQSGEQASALSPLTPTSCQTAPPHQVTWLEAITNTDGTVDLRWPHVWPQSSIAGSPLVDAGAVDYALQQYDNGSSFFWGPLIDGVGIAGLDASADARPPEAREGAPSDEQRGVIVYNIPAPEVDRCYRIHAVNAFDVESVEPSPEVCVLAGPTGDVIAMAERTTTRLSWDWRADLSISDWHADVIRMATPLTTPAAPGEAIIMLNVDLSFVAQFWDQLFPSTNTLAPAYPTVSPNPGFVRHSRTGLVPGARYCAWAMIGRGTRTYNEASGGDKFELYQAAVGEETTPVPKLACANTRPDPPVWGLRDSNNGAYRWFMSIPSGIEPEDYRFEFAWSVQDFSGSHSDAPLSGLTSWTPQSSFVLAWPGEDNPVGDRYTITLDAESLTYRLLPSVISGQLEENPSEPWLCLRALAGPGTPGSGITGPAASSWACTGGEDVGGSVEQVTGLRMVGDPEPVGFGVYRSTFEWDHYAGPGWLPIQEYEIAHMAACNPKGINPADDAFIFEGTDAAEFVIGDVAADSCVMVRAVDPRNGAALSEWSLSLPIGPFPAVAQRVSPTQFDVAWADPPGAFSPTSWSTTIVGGYVDAATNTCQWQTIVAAAVYGTAARVEDPSPTVNVAVPRCFQVSRYIPNKVLLRSSLEARTDVVVEEPDPCQPNDPTCTPEPCEPTDPTCTPDPCQPNDPGCTPDPCQPNDPACTPAPCIPFCLPDPLPVVDAPILETLLVFDDEDLSQQGAGQHQERCSSGAADRYECAAFIYTAPPADESHLEGCQVLSIFILPQLGSDGDPVEDWSVENLTDPTLRGTGCVADRLPGWNPASPSSSRWDGSPYDGQGAFEIELAVAPTPSAPDNGQAPPPSVSTYSYEVTASNAGGESTQMVTIDVTGFEGAATSTLTVTAWSSRSESQTYTVDSNTSGSSEDTIEIEVEYDPLFDPEGVSLTFDASQSSVATFQWRNHNFLNGWCRIQVERELDPFGNPYCTLNGTENSYRHPWSESEYHVLNLGARANEGETSTQWRWSFNGFNENNDNPAQAWVVLRATAVSPFGEGLCIAGPGVTCPAPDADIVVDGDSVDGEVVPPNTLIDTSTPGLAASLVATTEYDEYRWWPLNAKAIDRFGSDPLSASGKAFPVELPYEPGDPGQTWEFLLQVRDGSGWSAVPGATSTGSLRCSSLDGGSAGCPLGNVLVDVQIATRLSDAACTQGSIAGGDIVGADGQPIVGGAWGYAGSAILVTRGCRADFLYRYAVGTLPSPQSIASVTVGPPADIPPAVLGLRVVGADFVAGLNPQVVDTPSLAEWHLSTAPESVTGSVGLTPGVWPLTVELPTLDSTASVSYRSLDPLEVEGGAAASLNQTELCGEKIYDLDEHRQPSDNDWTPFGQDIDCETSASFGLTMQKSDLDPGVYNFFAMNTPSACPAGACVSRTGAHLIVLPPRRPDFQLRVTDESGEQTIGTYDGPAVVGAEDVTSEVVNLSVANVPDVDRDKWTYRWGFERTDGVGLPPVAFNSDVYGVELPSGVTDVILTATHPWYPSTELRFQVEVRTDTGELSDFSVVRTEEFAEIDRVTFDWTWLGGPATVSVFNSYIGPILEDVDAAQGSAAWLSPLFLSRCFLIDVNLEFGDEVEGLGPECIAGRAAPEIQLLEEDGALLVRWQGAFGNQSYDGLYELAHPDFGGQLRWEADGVEFFGAGEWLGSQWQYKIDEPSDWFGRCFTARNLLADGTIGRWSEEVCLYEEGLGPEAPLRTIVSVVDPDPAPDDGLVAARVRTFVRDEAEGAVLYRLEAVVDGVDGQASWELSTFDAAGGTVEGAVRWYDAAVQLPPGLDEVCVVARAVGESGLVSYPSQILPGSCLSTEEFGVGEPPPMDLRAPLTFAAESDFSGGVRFSWVDNSEGEDGVIVSTTEGGEVGRTSIAQATSMVADGLAFDGCYTAVAYKNVPLPGDEANEERSAVSNTAGPGCNDGSTASALEVVIGEDPDGFGRVAFDFFWMWNGEAEPLQWRVAAVDGATGEPLDGAARDLTVASEEVSIQGSIRRTGVRWLPIDALTCFRVWANPGAEDEIGSDIACANAGSGSLPAATLNAPGNLAMQSLGAGDFRLSWTDNSEGEVGVRMYYVDGGVEPVDFLGENVSEAVVSFHLNLEVASPCVHVVAFDLSGAESSASGEAGDLCGVPSGPGPSTIADSAPVWRADPNQVGDMGWLYDEVPANGTVQLFGFDLVEVNRGRVVVVDGDWLGRAPNPNGPDGWTWFGTGLPPAEYCVTLTALYTVTAAGSSELERGTTSDVECLLSPTPLDPIEEPGLPGEPGGPPTPIGPGGIPEDEGIPAPIEVRTYGLADGSVDVLWQSVSEVATGFEVELVDSSGAIGGLDLVGADVRSYVFANPGGAANGVCGRVTAAYEEERSSSRVACGPMRPSGVQVGSVSETTAAVTWQHDGEDVLAFVVAPAPLPAGLRLDALVPDAVELGRVPATGRSMTIDVPVGTCVHVIAVGAGGASLPSPSACATVVTPIPGGPTTPGDPTNPTEPAPPPEAGDCELVVVPADRMDADQRAANDVVYGVGGYVVAERVCEIAVEAPVVTVVESTGADEVLLLFTWTYGGEFDDGFAIVETTAGNGVVERIDAGEPLEGQVVVDLAPLTEERCFAVAVVVAGELGPTSDPHCVAPAPPSPTGFTWSVDLADIDADGDVLYSFTWSEPSAAPPNYVVFEVDEDADLSTLSWSAAPGVTVVEAGGSASTYEPALTQRTCMVLVQRWATDPVFTWGDPSNVHCEDPPPAESPTDLFLVVRKNGNMEVSWEAVGVADSFLVSINDTTGREVGPITVQGTERSATISIGGLAQGVSCARVIAVSNGIETFPANTCAPSAPLGATAEFVVTTPTTTTVWEWTDTATDEAEFVVVTDAAAPTVTLDPSEPSPAELARAVEDAETVGAPGEITCAVVFALSPQGQSAPSNPACVGAPTNLDPIEEPEPPPPPAGGASPGFSFGPVTATAVRAALQAEPATVIEVSTIVAVPIADLDEELPVLPIDIDSLIAAMTLPAPITSMSPAAEQLTQLETWLWVDPAQWAPFTETSIVGEGVTLTVTATPKRTVWDMGDDLDGGEDIRRCEGPGQPPSADRIAGLADCTYTYAHASIEEPGGIYDLGTTIEWQITWSLDGVPAADVRYAATEATATVTVLEAQALITGD